MRIIHVSHIANYTPPVGYGGIELVVDTLAKEQKAEGHDVVVLGVKPHNTHPKYEMLSVFKRPIKNPKLWHKIYLSTVLASKSQDFNIIHIHIQWLSLTASILRYFSRKAVLLTLHADPSPIVARFNVPMAAISKTQRRRLESKGFKIFGVAYNGIDVSKYSFSINKEDFFVYLGRIDQAKGTHRAVRAVRRSGNRLVIMGPIANPRYFNEFVKPFIDGKNIMYLGEVNFRTKVRYLAMAKALLYPVQYEEFFGIAMVEALATGTPVIGDAKGAVTEIVRHGINGFLVRDIEEMIKAMNSIDVIDPRECRKDAEQRFSSKSMARKYTSLYKRLTELT